MDSKDEIKQKTDIVELIGEYLELKPAGMQGFKTCCPFHGEKTPSFHVSSDKQIWHCFGCNEGGDVFSFVMKMDGMDFMEAMVHLGRKVGVEVTRFSSAEGNLKQRLLEIHELATTYYKKVLNESTSAKSARDYVRGRGIDEELSEKFGLGFSPDDWSKLSDFLHGRGFSESELVQAGISLKKKSGRGVIDRFRNRVMVPLRDQHSVVVGYTGRIMKGDDNGPKYMNSPETDIYHKGSLVYGLDMAKRAIKEKGNVIIVEGNLDVIASHKAGVENIVATSGTALTKDQLELLKRYTHTAVFCLDLDAAGFAATKKGVEIARSLEMDVRAIMLPEGVKDPDDLVQKDADAWVKLSNDSIPFMQFLIERTMLGKDVTKIDDKKAVARELLPALVQMKEMVEREHWLKKIAGLLGVEVSILRNSIENKVQKKEVPKVKESVVHVDPIRLSRENQAIFILIGSAINLDGSREDLFKKLDTIEIPDELLKSLYNKAKETYNLNIQVPTKSYFQRLRITLASEPEQEELVSLLDKISLFADKTLGGLSQQQVLTQLESLFQMLQDSESKIRKNDLAQKIRQAENAGDKETVNKLLRELTI
jgi:DNA primase